MSKHLRYAWLAAPILGALVSSTAIIGCKDDPPAATNDGSQAPTPTGGSNTLTTGQKPAGAPVARIDPETTKRNRIEACYFGSIGIEFTRDAYLASAKAGEFGPDHLPDFGDFPEQRAIAERQKKAEEKRAEKKAKEGEDKPAGTKGSDPKGSDAQAPNAQPPNDKGGRMMAPRETTAMRANKNIPYLRHLRACQHAKSATQAPIPGVDEALKDFEAYVSKVHQELVKATRYYAKDAYTKDEFKEGKAIDKALQELLPQYEEKRAALAKALDTWRAASKDWTPKDELDEAAKLSYDALYKARDLTLLLMAEKRDGAAIKTLLEELKKAQTDLDALRDSDKRAPHPKVFGPKLADFIKAAEEAAAISGDAALTPEQLYPVTSETALLFELHQRALEQLLRQKTARRPLKMINPQDGADRPNGSHRLRGGLNEQPEQPEPPEPE